MIIRREVNFRIGGVYVNILYTARRVIIHLRQGKGEVAFHSEDWVKIKEKIEEGLKTVKGVGRRR